MLDATKENRNVKTWIWFLVWEIIMFYVGMIEVKKEYITDDMSSSTLFAYKLVPWLWTLDSYESMVLKGTVKRTAMI